MIVRRNIMGDLADNNQRVNLYSVKLLEEEIKHIEEKKKGG